MFGSGSDWNYFRRGDIKKTKTGNVSKNATHCILTCFEIMYITFAIAC